MMHANKFLTKLPRYPSHHEFNAEKIFDETKVNKEISRIPHTNVKVHQVLNALKQKYADALNQFNKSGAIGLWNQMLEMFQQYQRNPASLKGNLYPLTKSFVDQLEPLIWILEANLLVQDTYMLARIMKRPSARVVIYVGDAHTDNLRPAFDEMGFEMLYHHTHLSLTHNAQCIDLTAVGSWPLF
jgi:hypothetical protein